MKNSIAVIGNIDSILIFKSVGFDVYGVDSELKARTTLNKAIQDYKLIFITDDYAVFTQDIIRDTINSTYPVITVIPSSLNKNDYAINQISIDMKKALGINILPKDNL